MLNSSPGVGTYDPNENVIRRPLAKEFKIAEATPRFDDYAFKKKLENSPQNLFYDVNDTRYFNH